MHLGVTVAHARVRHGNTPSLEQYGKFAEWAAAERFSGIELAAITPQHFASDFGDLKELARLGERCRSLALTINAFEAGFLRHMVVARDPSVRRQAVSDLTKSLRVAQALGTDLVYLHSAPHSSWKIEIPRLCDDFTPPIRVEVPVTFSWEAAWGQYVSIMKDMAQEAERARVRLGLEIRPCEMVSNADGMRRLAEAVGSPALGLVFDTAHLLVQKELLPVAIEKLRDRIFLVHLADNDGAQDYHWAPGKGVVPWDGVIAVLKKIGYRGFANIDVAGSYDDIDAEIRAGRDFIKTKM